MAEHTWASPSEVPLADGRGAAAMLLGRDPIVQAVRGDQRLSEDADDSGLQTGSPVVAAGEQRVPRRRTNAGEEWPSGEPHPLGREPIEARGGYLASFGIVAPHVSVAEVVGEDNDNIGYTPFLFRLRAQGAPTQPARK